MGRQERKQQGRDPQCGSVEGGRKYPSAKPDRTEEPYSGSGLENGGRKVLSGVKASQSKAMGKKGQFAEIVGEEGKRYTCRKQSKTSHRELSTQLSTRRARRSMSLFRITSKNSVPKPVGQSPEGARTREESLSAATREDETNSPRHQDLEERSSTAKTAALTQSASVPPQGVRCRDRKSHAKIKTRVKEKTGGGEQTRGFTASRGRWETSNWFGK